MWLRRPQDHSGCVHDDYRRVRQESVIVAASRRRYGSTTTAVPATRSRTVRPCRTHNVGRRRQSTSGSNGQSTSWVRWTGCPRESSPPPAGVPVDRRRTRLGFPSVLHRAREGVRPGAATDHGSVVGTPLANPDRTPERSARFESLPGHPSACRPDAGAAIDSRDCAGFERAQRARHLPARDWPVGGRKGATGALAR